MQRDQVLLTNEEGKDTYQAESENKMSPNQERKDTNPTKDTQNLSANQEGNNSNQTENDQTLSPNEERNDTYQAEKITDKTSAVKCVASTSKQYDDTEMISDTIKIIPDKEMEQMRQFVEENLDICEENNIELLDLPEDIQKKKKRSTRTPLKKCYLDFISDEEDFVWDSTSWKETDNDDDTSSSSENDTPRKKKRQK